MKYAEILKQFGFMPHLFGYYYAQEVLDIMGTQHFPVYLGEAYKDVATKNTMKRRCKPAQIERAIRHAIELAWDDGNELMRRKFKLRRPHVSLFLHTVIDMAREKKEVA